jgi:hypothetical protein
MNPALIAELSERISTPDRTAPARRLPTVGRVNKIKEGCLIDTFAAAR